MIKKIFLCAVLCAAHALGAHESITFGFVMAPIKQESASQTWRTACNRVVALYDDSLDCEENMNIAQELASYYSDCAADLQSWLVINKPVQENIETYQLRRYMTIEFTITYDRNADTAAWHIVEDRVEALVRYCHSTPWETFDYGYYFAAIGDVIEQAEALNAEINFECEVRE